jgi:hypothetical protein
MNESPNRHFWLRLARSWITLASCAAALVVASPGFKRIDAVAISGSSDWSAHAVSLAAAVAYLIAGAMVIAAGLALADFIRLSLDCEALLRNQLEELREVKVRARALPPAAGAALPTSRDILLSFGAAPGMSQGTGGSPLHGS